MADATQPLFNPNDRFGARDGGPYADQVELIAAETRRAAVEGRKPDYDNLLPTAGVPVVTEAQLNTLNGVGGITLPNPVGVGPVVEEADSLSKPKKDDSDQAKIEYAQAQDLKADAAPVDSIEVSKAEAPTE